MANLTPAHPKRTSRIVGLHVLVGITITTALVGLGAGLEVDIEAYGCHPGGRTAGACTAAFARALAAVSAAPGGGSVVVPGPGAYVTAGIEMLSGVTLEVRAGASINASATLSDWAPRRLVHPPCAAGMMPAELDHGVLGGLFFASLADNFTIKGPGAVNGGAAAWNGYGEDSTLAAAGPPNPSGLIRSNMFVFSQCKDVVVEDLQIQDSSAWTLNPQYSQRLSFRRLRITAPALGARGHNTDGFDPWACHDAEFVDSYYSAGDDCVAVKSGRDLNATEAGAWPCGTKFPASNIRINNVTCDGSHGLTIGSEMSGGIDGVTFSNIDIRNSGPSVRIKSQCGRRAYVRNVLYENITADEVGNAVWIDMQYFSTATHCPASEVSEFSNITVRNLQVDRITDNGDAYSIVGLAVDPDSSYGSDGAGASAGAGDNVGTAAAAGPAPVRIPIHNITLENVHVKHYGRGGQCTYADVRTFNISPPLPRGYGCGGKPPPTCKVVPAGQLCYDDSTKEGLGLQSQTQVHDHTTLELCAAACSEAALPVVGVDGGNHCFCGGQGSLADHAALLRPLAECQATPCYSNKTEKCGGPGRMLSYNYTCEGW